MPRLPLPVPSVGGSPCQPENSQPLRYIEAGLQKFVAIVLDADHAGDAAKPQGTPAKSNRNSLGLDFFIALLNGYTTGGWTRSIAPEAE